MDKIYQPTIVIGLGGTGKNILLSLKKIIAENSPNGMADFPFLRILSVDTDVSFNMNGTTLRYTTSDITGTNYSGKINGTIKRILWLSIFY